MTTIANSSTPRQSNFLLGPPLHAPHILVKKESLAQLNQPISSPLNPAQSTPRNLSIRFAPLPDPRASRANVPGRLGQLDVWWSREEKSDGTWGDYRLVLRRPNGQIVALDDLEPGSDEQTRALETYRQQQPSRPSASPLSNLTKPPFWDTTESRLNSNLLGAQSIGSSEPFFSQSGIGKLLLPSLTTQTSNLTHSSCNSNSDPHSAGSNTSGNPLALTPTASCDSTYSNYSFSSNQKASTSSSLTKKFLDAMKKPITKHSHRLTPTNSLPIQGDYYGAPLCKTRSADSTAGSIRKRFHFAFAKNPQILRRTRSKEESSNQDAQLGFDEPPARRRSNYPPVAQRKAHMGGGRGGAGKVVLAEEPDFVEWKPATATPSPGTVASSQRPDHAVEDDGSGMAWLRKRKREREERARREEEERAQFLANASKSVPLATIDETQLAQDELSKNQTPEIDSDNRSASRADDLKLSSHEDNNDDDRDSSASSICESSILSRDGAHASGGTRTSTSSATPSSKDFNADEDEDLNEEELKEEERLKALALSHSPFVKGVSEVYRDREHHQISRKSTEMS